MNKKTILTLVLGITLGIAFSASVIKATAQAPNRDNEAITAALTKITEQNEKLLAGQDALMKELALIKSDVQFLKARSGQ